MKARYIRISSTSQSTQRQLVRLEQDEKLYEDTESGSIPFKERKQAKKLIDDCKILNIKSISVSSVDRLGRDAFDIQQTIEFFSTKNINIVIDNLGIQSIVDGKTNPIFKMITDVLANVSQMEKESIRERQLEGIALAKKNGTYKGREKGSKESPEEFLKKHSKAVKEILKEKNKNHTLRELARLSHVSSNTVRKIISVINESKKG
jgi:DNA invertase Pin-like site-specific DNA recombinase